nr:hypothetical protein [uncultured Methanobrevibacter sp.]
MAWINVGNIKGETGASGRSVNVYKDTSHGQIIFVGDDTEAIIYLSELKGAKGDTGATGPAGPVNMTSTLDTSDTTNAVTNSAIATEIESIQTAIGNITSAQQSNLTLLGS